MGAGWLDPILKELEPSVTSIDGAVYHKMQHYIYIERETDMERGHTSVIICVILVSRLLSSALLNKT